MFLFFSSLNAQTYLSLENPGRFKRIRIYPGDSLQIKVKGDPTWYRGYLNGLKNDQVLMFGDSLPVDSLSHIGYPRPKLARYWMNMIRVNMYLLAVFAPAMVILNVGLRQMKLKHYVILFGVPPASMAFARLLREWTNKKFKLGKRWRLKIRSGPAEKGGRNR